MSAHYFFALALPDEVKEELSRLTEEIQKKRPFKKLVHPLDYHITLVFLGGADEAMLGNAIEGVRGSLADFPSFKLQADHVGTFGNRKEPRVLWAGVNRSDELHELQRLTASACLDAGFDLEKRPYAPHITLGRKWAGAHPFSAEELEKEAAPLLPLQSFIAGEAVLYRTRLDRTPKYEKIERFIF